MFKRVLLVVLTTFFFSSLAIAANPKAVIKTSQGDIEVELYQDKAPLSVSNFTNYANNGFYNNTIFHRVIPGFMIQGGGFDANMVQKAVSAPIKNEAANGLKNTRGTIAMARTSIVDSATSQFFINLVDNDYLDHKGTAASTYGYAVFGKVTKGMDVADKIAKVQTGRSGMHHDVPVEPVTILSVTISK